MNKIILLDVDGTLTDYHNRVLESAIEAVQQAHQNGYYALVCMGCSRTEMQPELWEIGLNDMIGDNGSYVEHSDQVIMHQLILKEDTKATVNWLHERGLGLYLESNNDLFVSENFREVIRSIIR